MDHNENTSEELRARSLRLEQENLALKQALQETNTNSFDWRSFWSSVLLGLSLVVIIVAGILVWLNRTVFDESSYIKSVGPIIQLPEVQKAITIQASDKLFSEVNVEQKVADSLPSNADFLAAPIANQVETQGTAAISKIVASDSFYKLWIATNKRAQNSFVKLAKNGPADPSINVNDVYQYVSTQMSDTRLAPLLNKELPPRLGNIEVANVPAVASVSHWASLLNTWRWVFVFFAFALPALAIAIARDRMKVVARTGYVWMLAAVLSLVVIRIVRGILLSDIKIAVNRDAAIAVWQTVLQYYYIQVAVLFIFGVVLAALGWYLSDNPYFVRFRQKNMGRMGELRSFLHVSDKAAFPGFMQRHRGQAEWTVLGLTLLSILLMVPLSIGSALVILLLALLVLGVVEMLAAPSPTVIGQ